MIPREVWPDPTAVNACSICTSFPVGLKVVREKDHWLSPMVYCLKMQRGKTENASVWERKTGIFTWGLNFAFLVGEEGVFLGGLLKITLKNNSFKHVFNVCSKLVLFRACLTVW